MRQRMRMIFDLPAEIQVAIRLKAAKTGKTNADVIYMAMEKAFPQEVAEAKEAVKDNLGESQPKDRRTGASRLANSA